MGSEHILVVEDNPANQKLLVRYLTAKGYRVVAAADTAEADSAIAHEKPALVLVDMSLPGEDGMSWVKRLRKDGLPDVPMVALTAHALPADKQRALDAGCNEFLTKPVELKALLKVVEQHLPRPPSSPDA